MKTKEAIITLQSQEEFDRLLEFLESRGIHWRSSAKPTAYIDYYPIWGVFLHNDWIVCAHQSEEAQGEYKCPHFTVDEFIKENSNSMKSIFTKDDLKNGMLVKTRANRVYLYLEYSDEGYMCCVFVRDTGYIGLDMFNYDLTVRGGNQEGFDIMKVYKPVDFITTLRLDDQIDRAELIWKREEEKPVEMTVSEIAEKLGIKNLKIIKEKE